MGRPDRPGDRVHRRGPDFDRGLGTGHRRARPRSRGHLAAWGHCAGLSRSHRGPHRADDRQDPDGDLRLRTRWRARVVAGNGAQPRCGAASSLAGGCRPPPPQPSAAASGRPAHRHDRSPGGALTAVLLALAASVSWGIGDFVAGINTRRLGVFTVLFISQPPTFVLIAIVVIVRGGAPRPGLWMIAGVVAGLAGLVGLSAVYRGWRSGLSASSRRSPRRGPWCRSWSAWCWASDRRRCSSSALPWRSAG